MEDGRAGHSGDGMIPANARKTVSVDEDDAETVETVVARARDPERQRRCSCGGLTGIPIEAIGNVPEFPQNDGLTGSRGVNPSNTT